MVWKAAGSTAVSDTLLLSRSRDSFCSLWGAFLPASVAADTEVTRRNSPLLVDHGFGFFLFYSSDTRIYNAPTRDFELALVQTPANPNFGDTFLFQIEIALTPILSLSPKKSVFSWKGGTEACHPDC